MRAVVVLSGVLVLGFASFMSSLVHQPKAVILQPVSADRPALPTGAEADNLYYTCRAGAQGVLVLQREDVRCVRVQTTRAE